MKILVVDSDLDMVEMLAGWLKARGYEVRHAFTGERARVEWVQHRPDLVILDTSLKGTDALAMSRELRCEHDALVLALSSDSSADAQIYCLESGADSFLIKPFLPGQMQAHIHALARRVRSTLARNPNYIATVGPITIDALQHIAQVRGKTVRLTPTQSKILHLLAANVNNICTLDQIVSHVWGYGSAGDTYLIKAHIRHLREKLEINPSKPRYIITVTGVGYSLRNSPDEPAATHADADADTVGSVLEVRVKPVPVRSRVLGA